MRTKVINFILALIFVVSMITPTYANEQCGEYVELTAKIAIATNIKSDGSNLTNDSHLGKNIQIGDKKIGIKEAPDNRFKVWFEIEGENVLVEAKPIAKSENGKAIYYEATTTNEKYTVVNVEYVDNAETNMFFKSYKNEYNKNSILKIYLRENKKWNRNYVILECFDYQIKDFDSLWSKLSQNALMGAWVTKEFVPLSSDYKDKYLSMLMDTSNIERTYTVKYTEFLEEEVHKIKIAADCQYSQNIRVGGKGTIVYRLEVIGKSMSCATNPSLNSKTKSSLHLVDISLSQTTIPNVAFMSTSIDGKAQKSELSDVSLSASIGVNKSALGISLSIPSSFLGNNIVDLNETYQGYVNGRNHEYTRSIKTKMDDKYRISLKGGYFEVKSTVGDFGNVSKKSALHKARWDFTILNAGDLSTMKKSISQNVPITISN